MTSEKKTMTAKAEETVLKMTQKQPMKTKLISEKLYEILWLKKLYGESSPTKREEKLQACETEESWRAEEENCKREEEVTRRRSL